MGGSTTAPISASAVSTRRWPRCSGLSRTTRMSCRPSLSVTSAARAIRVSAAQWATAAADLMLHGTITMPSVLNAPEAIAGPMSRVRPRREVLDVIDRVVGLLDDGTASGVRDDQVRFDVRDATQQFQEADAVDRAGGAADPDPQTLHSRNPPRYPSSR